MSSKAKVLYPMYTCTCCRKVQDTALAATVRCSSRFPRQHPSPWRHHSSRELKLRWKSAGILAKVMIGRTANTQQYMGRRTFLSTAVVLPTDFREGAPSLFVLLTKRPLGAPVRDMKISPFARLLMIYC